MSRKSEKLSSVRIADEDGFPISSTEYGVKRALDIFNPKDDKTVAHREMMMALKQICERLERMEEYIKEISGLEL